MRADHAKTKDYCMTRFFGHGQSILQVFETSIALSMVKSVKSPFFQTLLVPISWTLAICNSWFSSYLSNRKQYTQVNEHRSSLKEITCGVPQCSILGPILFLIYINDISNSTELNLLSFADDTTIYCSETTLYDNRKKATSVLTKILDWLHANRLSLNINKTNFTIFGPQCSARDYSSCTIRLNGQDIKHVNECKFLGIYLDTHLTRKRHIEKISSKISSAIFAINRAKDFLSKHALRCLYFALVHRQLTYGIHVGVGGKSEWRRSEFGVEYTAEYRRIDEYSFVIYNTCSIGACAYRVILDKL